MSSGFVSSVQLEEEQKKRQEEWEKVRKPDDPLEAPVPEVCTKSLFEQLRDVREAKELEKKEELKMRSMIRGIDEDESHFLSMIDDIKSKEQKEKKEEEILLLKEMNKVRAAKEPSTSNIRIDTPGQPKISKQAQLLSGMIKRKSTTNEEETKKRRREDSEQTESERNTIQVMGVLPGMAGYSDSSESDSDSSSDADIVPVLQMTEPARKEHDS